MVDLTIADVRAKFPQYDDLSDQQLADALHQRYYSDMDQADFYGRIGFEPAQAAPAAGPAEFADQAQSLEFPTPPAPRPDPRVAPAMPPMPAPPSAPPTVQVSAPARTAQPDPLVAALQPAAPAPTPTPTPTQAVPARPMPVDPILQTQGPGPGGGMGQLYDQGILPRRYVEDPLAGAMAPQAPAPVEEDPFANEGFGALAQRRGQQFARGATEAFAAVPEAIAVQMANADQRDFSSGEYKMALADQYEVELGQIDTRIGEIEVALGTNGNPRPSRENRLDSEQRAALEAEYQEIMGRRNQINLAIGDGGLEAYRADALADMTTRANLNEEGVVTPAGDREMFSYGDVVRDASTNTFGTPDPRDTSFWAGVAEGGGNMTGMAITALATSAVTTPLGGVAIAGGQGAAMNSSQMYREAIEMGADEETARLAANWGAAIGASEIIPINRALKLLPPRLRGQIGQGFLRRFADIAQSSGEEAAQEYLATVANNIVADNLYDPGRGWTEGATEAALVGAVLGAGTGTVGTLLDSRGDAPANARPEAPQATPSAETPPEVAQDPPAPQAPAEGDTPNAPRTPEPPAAPRQAPAQPAAPAAPVAPDPLTASMGASPAREEAAPDVAEAMAPPPAEGGRFEIMDEVETVDGESVPTGRQVRVNLDTGEVSPVDPASAPEQREAVQSQPQDVPDVGTDDAPAAGEAVVDEAEDAGSPEANSAGDAAISSIRTETLPSEAVAQVETDAATFQYKDNGDEAGVTDRLQGITDWDERSAMGGIIFEYADGRRVVADGHQRLGLAKRLQQNGVRTPWNVEIIRETDGFTPADVRRIAALKNIREGSGTAIDAAKVLRGTPDDIDSLNLPPRSALVRDARGLARLSDDAFGMVVNEVVRSEWGAAVGENVADQALHVDVVSLLNKLQPKNNAQAAMIAQQAGQEAVTETQTSLFGDEQVAESLYLERAKVRDAALKRLKQDRATFKVLSDRANTISEEGNVLNSEANAQRVEADSKAAAYLTAEANRKGPISDALTAAARDLKANPRQGARVVRAFLETLRAPAGSEPQGAGSDRGRADPQAEPRQEGVDQPQSETTDAGEQSLFPGIEPVTDRQRAEADMAKPMSERDTGPASGRDDLFGNPDDRHDLFDDAPSTVGTFVDRATDPDDALFKDRSADLPNRIPTEKLATEAKRLTLESGRKDGVEYLMLIDGEGQIVAYGSGHETGTGVPGAMMLMGEKGERIVAHHNHPSSNGFSASDLAFALMPGAEIVYAHGHDGSTFAVRSTALGRSMWAGARNEFERQAQITKDLSTAMDNMWRKSNDAIGRLVDDGTYPAESDNGKPAGTYLQPGRDRSFAFMLAMEQAGVVEIDVTGPAAARFKADVNPYLLDPELKKLYENLVRTLRRRVKDADTEGNHDRPTAARRHPGELASSPEAPATDQARQPDDGGRDQAGQGRDPREGSQSSVDDADFLGALDDVFGADTDQARDGQIQITEPPKKRAKADIAKDMQAVLRGLKEDGGLFGDTPQPSRTMTQEQRAELEARARQSKMRTSKRQEEAGPLFDTQQDLFGFDENAPATLADQIDALENITPGWTSAPGGMLTNPHTRGGIIDKQLANGGQDTGKWFIVFGNGWEAADGFNTRGEAVAEYVQSMRTGTNPTKYRQLAPLFAEALDSIDPTAQSRRETFSAMMRPLVDAGLTRDDVQALQPYFTRFLDDVGGGKIDLEGDVNASGTGSDLEPDRGDTDAGDGVGGTDVPAATGADGPRADQGRGAVDAKGGQRQGGGRVSDGDAAPVGTQSDQGIPGRERDGGQPADDRDGAGGRDRGEQGLSADPGRAEDTAQYASDAPDVVDRKTAQAEADAVKVIPGDRANIDKTLPLLLPEQRDDVWKVEQRFGKTDKDGNPIGHGMLLTNGTGTGKTYSGGGVIKRYAQQGKDNILILAPSQGILDAWVDMGTDMGLDISKLEDTTSAGTGIVATTYANAGENVELAKRDWDLVVTDESQKLSQNAMGGQTSALLTVRAITNRPENLRDRAMMLRADDWARMQQMPDNSQEKGKLARDLHDDLKVQVEELAKKPRSKVLFLSATPFAYDKNVDYAEGYLFQYGADGVTESGSRQDGRNLFFVENFGYRIRYHKLTKPEAAVDNGVFEREFHERLKREGVLSGRSLDIAADYDRKFVKISSADGEQIDAAMRLIWDKSDNTPAGRKWRELGDHVRRNFTYLRRLQLLEAIKAESSVPDIKAHLDMGRKVVVFHDYNKGGGFNPFMGSDVVTPTDDAMEGYKLLLQEMPEVADLNFSGLGSPIETLTAAFGKRARVYNGTVSQKERAETKSEFNRDGSGVDVIIVQSAAGEAGISLHDTTGGHQRALINLGMPVRPTTTLQEEGRIRRVGSMSDAIFRYYTTGTAWERQAFAGKIAENSGTVENLALGNEARAIREAFISAYMDAGDYKPSLEDGRGGRDADRSTATTSPYDQAKTHYFARTKNNQKRDRRAGFDFYATPEPLGFKMAEWAKVRTYEKVLEPSAGDGAIARYFPGDADRTIIEPSMDLITKAQLRAPGSKAIQEQFEDHYIGNKYDAVVMNPPFGSGGKTAMEHMAKAARHLRPGGRLVALVPTGPAADKQLAKQMTDGEPLADLQWTADIALPSVTFEKADTSVAARVVIFDKVGKDADENHQTKRINMRGAQSIADFFDRLEGIDVPQRPAVTERAEEVEGVTSPAPVSEDSGFESFEFQNTKTGADVYGVQITENLGDRFKEVAGIAKSHGGYYSRYQNKAAGARRGFLFKSDEDRTAFIEDVQKPRFGLEETSTEFPAERAVSAKAIAPAMPALRAELDRLNLKRVKLGQDTSGQRLGAFRADTDGALEILIGPSLDPEATLYHESIHAMRTLKLFTPQEWRALEIKAAKNWVEQYDIAKRYPDLLPSEQIEEAIAEAFADAAKTRTAPKGSILVQAFNKIARLLKALGNSLRGAGFQTAEDVFGRAMAGEIGARDAGNTGFVATMREARTPARKRQTAQQRVHSATAMSANGGFAYIPDRRIWEELSASGAGVWQRLRGGAAAANDWADKARIKIQDRFLPVLRAQEAIIRSTGQPISEEQNAYLAEETFSGKVGRHLFEIDEDFTKRIIDIMAGGNGEVMLDAEYVGNWLYARHAQERNARIASINPNMQDGGSGMTNAESAQILADAAASPNAARLQEIGDLIDKLRERTLKLREDAGLITPVEADLWRNQYKHYVPLKGFADTDHSEAMLDVTGMGRRFNTRGAETKRALGRRSEAFNPLQGAITQAQEVAIRAEKNRVGQALYKLAKDFPSPDLWSVKTPKQKRYYNRTTGLVETRVEDPVSLFLEPNELAVKINGQERRILFHDNRLAQAAGTVGADQMNWFIGLMSKASRWFSSVNTMLDPEFVIRNAFRDMTAAQINIRNFGEGDRNALAKAMIKNWPKAWRAAYRGQLNKTDTEWDKYYREFDQVGAKVSFWKLEQPEAEMQDLARRVKMAGGNLGQRASRFLRISTRDNPVLGFIERVNLAVDNAIRLAAYVEARKQGWSKSDAASLSKNLTVNFNRRGEWGASINALYPFANAGIQGTQILFRAMSSKRMAKYALGMVALGFILDQMNAAMSEEDEDGELAYDKIPDWKNQMNLVVMLGPDAGNAATFWLPYGYNLFPYMGQQLSKIMRGVKQPGDAMGDFAGAMFGSFSPLGGRDLQSVLTPTMLDPINEMAMNQDWLGRPIRPENPYSDYGPDAYKYFGGASIASREIADAMNRATGGTIAEPGFIDVSPEYIDHAFGFATGGAGRFWGRTTDTLGKLMRGEIDDIEARNIPFYRSLQYQTGDWLDRGRYYRFREQVREARDAMKTYQDAGMPVPEHVRRTAGLYDASREAERALRKMRSETRGLEARNDLSAAEISERRAAIDERAANVYLRFNQIFVRVNGPRGE